MPLFIFFALVVLFAGHYFLYYSFTRFFSVTEYRVKFWLALVLAVLPLSFVGASILSRYYDNWFTKKIYFAASLWGGIALTLATVFAFSWLVLLLLKTVGISGAGKHIGIAAVVIAFCWSGFGVYNAYNPHINEIAVKIKNLPEAWRGKKAVQISDVHLGNVLDERFFQRVVDMVNARHPDIVFITGDLFDGMDGSLDQIVKPVGNIMAPLGIYYVTGNHETYLGVKETYVALRKTKIRILDDEMVNIDGLQVIGMSYPEQFVSKDLRDVVGKITDFDRSRPSVLLHHDPTETERAKELGISLQLSGHAHKGQIFPIMFISRLVYGKYYSGLHEEGDYTVFTSNGVGVWGPTMRTGNSPEIDVINFETK